MLTGCTREFIEGTIGVDYETTNRFAKNLAPLPGQFVKDEAAFERLVASFTGNIESHWGKNDVRVAGKRDYVKYTDNYLSRASVDFERGRITIETVATTDPKSHLKQAIITTLLTPEDPAHVDLYSDRGITLEGQPFLLGQVVDQEGKDITWEWRANRFADYLIDHRMKTRKVKFQKSFYVEIPLVRNHWSKRKYKYQQYVRAASRKYGISEDLIYAIIKTESSFNPYAVSWLMPMV